MLWFRFFSELEYELELLLKEVELEPSEIDSLSEPVPIVELILILELIPAVELVPTLVPTLE